MIQLSADNLWATVTAADDADLAWLREYLTVPVKNAENSDAYQAGHWDGNIKLYDARRSRFASGLLRLVGGRAREAGVVLELTDVRVKPPGEPDPTAGAWLRDYQREALAVILRRGRGIVSLPTAGGKTEIFAAAVQAVRVRWLVLVDTKDLMHQAAERILLRTGEQAGLAGDGEWDPRRVTVCTLQTHLAGIGQGGKVDELLAGADGIFADEVQVLSAREFNRVAFACENAWWRVGLSATPIEREDENDYMAIAALGPLIVDIPARKLIADGWLAKPEIWMVEHQHERMSGTFAEVYEAGVTLNQSRNDLVVDLACSSAACPRPSLVFFRALPHGRRLLKAIEPRARVDLVQGSDQTRRRDRARHRLAVGLSDVLLTSRIFNKGIDLPDVLSGVNAAAGASVIDAVQKVGRGLRIPKDSRKRTFRYYDVLDLGNYMLEGHARKRLAAYRARDYADDCVRVVRQGDLPK